MTTHPFLSDPWIAEARRIKEAHVGDPTDQPGPHEDDIRAITG